MYPHGSVYEGQMNDKGERHGFGRLLRPISFIGWWHHNNLVGNAYAFDEDGKFILREGGWLADNVKVLPPLRELEEGEKYDQNRLINHESVLTFKNDLETVEALKELGDYSMHVERFGKPLKGEDFCVTGNFCTGCVKSGDEDLPLPEGFTF